MSWTQIYDIAPPGSTERRDWTRAIIGRSIYLFQAGHDQFLRVNLTVPNSPTIETFQPTFLAAALTNGSVQGIFPARGRLGCWDVAGAIYWSAVDNHEDFTPSLETAASVVTPTALRGRIATILGTSNGFIVYTTSNILQGVFSNQGEVFNIQEFDPSIGIFSSDHVTEGESGVHYVWSQTQLYKLNPGTIVGQHSVQLQHVELAHFMRYFKGYPKLGFHTNRYLVIQVAEQDFVEGQSVTWRDYSPGNEYFYAGLRDLIEFGNIPDELEYVPPGQFVPPPPPVPFNCEVEPTIDPVWRLPEPPPDPRDPYVSRPWPEADDEADYFTIWAMNMHETTVPTAQKVTYPAGQYYEVFNSGTACFVTNERAVTKVELTEESATALLEDGDIFDPEYSGGDSVVFKTARRAAIPAVSFSPEALCTHQFRKWRKETSDHERLIDALEDFYPYTEEFTGWTHAVETEPDVIASAAAPDSSARYVASSASVLSQPILPEANPDGDVYVPGYTQLANTCDWRGTRSTITGIIESEPVRAILSEPQTEGPEMLIRDEYDRGINGANLGVDTYVGALLPENFHGPYMRYVMYFPGEGPFDSQQRSQITGPSPRYPINDYHFQIPGHTNFRLVMNTDGTTYATCGLYPHFNRWLRVQRRVRWYATPYVEIPPNIDDGSAFDNTELNHYATRIRYVIDWELVEQGSGYTALNDVPNGFAGVTNVPRLDENFAYPALKIPKAAGLDPRPVLREYYMLAVQRNPTNPLAELKAIYEANGFTVERPNFREPALPPEVPLTDFSEDPPTQIYVNGEDVTNGQVDEAIEYGTNCGQPLDEVIDLDEDLLPASFELLPAEPVTTTFEFNTDPWRIVSPDIVSLQGNVGTGPYYPRYTRAFVFDIAFQKWGICGVPHMVFSSVTPLNEVAHDPLTNTTTSHFTYENYLSRLCCVLENGITVFFDTTSHKSYLVIGKFGAKRRTLSKFLEASWEFVEIPDCYVAFEPTTEEDSRLVQPASTRLARPQSFEIKMPVFAHGRNAYLTVVGGRFELIQVTMGLLPAGDR